MPITVNNDPMPSLYGGALFDSGKNMQDNQNLQQLLGLFVPQVAQQKQNAAQNQLQQQSVTQQGTYQTGSLGLQAQQLALQKNQNASQNKLQALSLYAQNPNLFPTPNVQGPYQGWGPPPGGYTSGSTPMGAQNYLSSLGF